MRKPEFIDERLAGCIARKAVDRDDQLEALSSVTFNLCTNTVGIIARMTNELLFLAQDHTRYEGYMDNPGAQGALAVTRHALYHLVTNELRLRSDLTYVFTETTLAFRFQNEMTPSVQRALAPYFTEKATLDAEAATVTCDMVFPDGSTLTQEFPLLEPLGAEE